MRTPLFNTAMRRAATAWAALFLAALLAPQAVDAAESAAEKPNIIFILADDMGYGDVSHAGGLAPTPHIDRLRAEGMRFTDPHTTSLVCTPTPYGILLYIA